ncbi:MAG: class I SAM-dependent methyltransferase [Candidatus Bathyarchaeia archaeon]
MKEEEMLYCVLAELGDIQGWNALDMGSGPCSMAVCLANKIGDGRVFAVDLFTRIMNNLRKALTWDRFLRTVVIKADLRRLDFLKDDFVDLITAYDTLSVIDQYTPGGTPHVLNEARRVLKPGGWFIALDHEPVESIEPLDKAEEVEVRWWKIHMDVEKALKEPSGTEYTATELMETLREAGFEISHWRRTERGEMGEGMRFGTKIRERANRIADENLRKTILDEMKEVEEDGATYGMQEFPRYAIYAKNSLTPPKILKPLPLRALFQTVRHRDLLL